MRSIRCILALAGLTVPLVLSGTAWADISSWAFAGAGAVAWKEGTQPLAPRPAMAFDVGVGTTPDGRFIFGGLVRLMPVIGVGSDVAMFARAATHGFQAGSFGVALDVGAYQRLWGSYGRGFAGGLTVGFPLGLSVSMQGMFGQNDALSFGAVAGIDFLRLTVYRQFMTDRWPNPLPAHEVQKEARLFPVGGRF